TGAVHRAASRAKVCGARPALPGLDATNRTPPRAHERPCGRNATSLPFLPPGKCFRRTRGPDLSVQTAPYQWETLEAPHNGAPPFWRDMLPIRQSDGFGSAAMGLLGPVGGLAPRRKWAPPLP